MAFLALFLYGSGELINSTRPKWTKLGALQYFQYLMQYSDTFYKRFKIFRIEYFPTTQCNNMWTIFAKKSQFNGIIEQLRNTMTINSKIVKCLYLWYDKIRRSNSY